MRIWLERLGIVSYFAFAAAFFWLAFNLGAVLGQEYLRHENCVRFGVTNTECCCTNRCCDAIEPSAIIHIEGEMYRIVATGQVVRRTGWSTTGEIIRCACDPVPAAAGVGTVWMKHDLANTRCLFIPPPGSS